MSILDICTGTGCIPLLLAKASSRDSKVTALGVDISPSAIDLARLNARNSDFSGVSFVHGDLFSASFVDEVLKHNDGRPFDVVTCNPPYIPQPEYDLLAPSVKNFEDQGALLGGDADGLSFYRRLSEVIIEDGRTLLARGGILAVEHGDGQCKGVSSIFEIGLGTRLKRLETWKDQWGKERTVVAFT